MQDNLEPMIADARFSMQELSEEEQSEIAGATCGSWMSFDTPDGDAANCVDWYC